MLTLRLKVKSESYDWLNKAAIEVNQVWNYCAQIGADAYDSNRRNKTWKWLTGFDLCAMTKGTSEQMERIIADTIQKVCIQYANTRNSLKKLKLKYRKSHGSNRSLGWVPFKAQNLKLKGKHLRFAGKTFRVFDAGRLQGVKFHDGCFAQDSLGDWYICIPYDMTITNISAPKLNVGIDLGLKTAAVTSDGATLISDHYRKTEAKIAQAQKRGHKKQAKRLHRKAARQRQDAVHKFSREIVDTYQNIYIGDVSSKFLIAGAPKSALDSAHGMLKAQLHYKGQQASRSVEIVNESNTTRRCSDCGFLTGPHGLRGLDEREWTCGNCDSTHDRDVNAAINICHLGSRHQTSVCGNEDSSAIGLRDHECRYVDAVLYKWELSI